MERFKNFVSTKILRPEASLPLPMHNTVIAPEQIFPTQADTRTTELTNEEKAEWQSAYFGRDFMGKPAYGISLTLQEDPSIKVYGTMEMDYIGMRIEIPIADPTPEDILLEDAYLKTTIFGTIDPEVYKQYASEQFQRTKLMAFLNRNVAGVEPEEMMDWFIQTYKVDHQTYGTVQVSSHGGLGEYGYEDAVTINSADRRHISYPRDTATDICDKAVHKYNQQINASLPYITTNPLPVTTFLDEIQSTLKFLPQDWKA